MSRDDGVKSKVLPQADLALAGVLRSVVQCRECCRDGWVVPGTMEGAWEPAWDMCTSGDNWSAAQHM